MGERGNKPVLVEVVHAMPAKQRIVELQVAPGTTARDAALRSGLAAEFAELDLARVPLGVFGVQVSDTHVLRPGDRVELYRPLLTEPREARRQAAAGRRPLGGGSA